MSVAHYLGGEWKEGSGCSITSYSAWDGDEIGKGNAATLMDIIPALSRCNEVVERASKKRQDDFNIVKMAYETVVHAHFDDWSVFESKETGVSLSYLRNKVKPKIIEMIQSSELPDGIPSGLQLVLLPSVGALECALNISFQSLICGNGVLLVPSKRASQSVISFMQRIVKVLPDSERINMAVVDPEHRDMLLRHPAILQVVAIARPNTLKTIEKSTVGSEKKFVGLTGGKNTAIVLPDANLSKTAKCIVHGAFTGGGELGLNFSRILVSHKVFEEFESELTSAIDAFEIEGPVSNCRTLERMKGIIPQLLDSEGQEFKQKSFTALPEKGVPTELHVYRHVSFCSEWQQDLMDAPILLLNDFKYNHEAVKWANMTPYGLTISVFTEDDEKFKKVAEKLECSHVMKNAWLGMDMSLPVIGAKSSVRGLVGGADLQDIFLSRRNYR